MPLRINAITIINNSYINSNIYNIFINIYMHANAHSGTQVRVSATEKNKKKIRKRLVTVTAQVTTKGMARVLPPT